MKEQNKTPGKIPNATEIKKKKLPDIEFIMVKIDAH